MASDEEVLAKSIGLNQFNRDSQATVQEADKLYQPYLASDDRGEQVAMLFRDRTLSGKVGFTYSGQSGEAGANDFMARLHSTTSGPY
jgi:alpha-amylase/alpha-mannosidase (GH57 family)